MRVKIVEYFLNLRKNHHIKFLAVGAYNTLFGFMIGNILLLMTSDHDVIMPLLITYLISLLHNYFSFEKLVFHSNIGFLKGLFRLNNSSIITEMIRILLVSILVYSFQINDNIAYNLVFPVTLTIKYFLHRKYTFNANFK